MLVVADGPRADHPDDIEKCAAARAIIEQVDWDCEVLTNYSEKNLGCKRRVSSGLKWVFEYVEKAIILEDDCLLHPTFFRFAEELLEKYADDNRILSISGNNFQFGKHATDYSYYFSHYTHIWGWATWRRSMDLFDPDIALWPEIRDDGWLDNIFKTKAEVAYWRSIFERVYSKKIDAWAYSWFLMSLVQHGLNILPTVNLVSNIGFAADSTHTTDASSTFANIPAEAMTFPLEHPPFVIRHKQADLYTKDEHFHISPFYKRLLRKIRKILQKGIGKIKPNSFQ